MLVVLVRFCMGEGGLCGPYDVVVFIFVGLCVCGAGEPTSDAAAGVALLPGARVCAAHVC